MSEYQFKIAFFGNNCEVLSCLHNLVDVVAVFTRPDDGSNSSVKAVGELAQCLEVPVYQPLKNELIDYAPYIIKENLDFIIVCGYKYIIPVSVFSLPRYGTINIHPSLLPNYRGQHVINWAIINGQTETGVTLHLIDDQLDTGDVLVQKRIPIFIDDTARDLHDRIYVEACKLLNHFFAQFKMDKKLSLNKQDSSKATFFKPRKPSDGCVNWGESGIQIYNLVRAISEPWPGAFTFYNSYKVVIWDVSFKNSQSQMPFGTIVNVCDSELTVVAKDSLIIIKHYDIFDENGCSIEIKLKKGDILGKGGYLFDG